MSNKNFERLNWLSIIHSFKQCITSTVFRFAQNKCPAYLNEVFRQTEIIRVNATNSYLKLNNPFGKISTGQNGLSYIGLANWNKISDILKKAENLKISFFSLNISTFFS